MMEIIKTVVKGAVLTRENERGRKTAIFRLVWAGRNITLYYKVQGTNIGFYCSLHTQV
jgi:hypothetical protein